MLLRLIPDYMKNMLLPITFEQEFIKSPHTLSAANSGILTPSSLNTKNTVLKLSYPVVDNPPLYIARGVFDQVKFLLPIFYLPPIDFPEFSYYLVDKEQDEKLEAYLNEALSNFDFKYNENILAIYINPDSKDSKAKSSNSIHKSIEKSLSDFNKICKNEIEDLAKSYKKLELEFNKRLKVENDALEKHKLNLQNHKKEVDSLDKQYWAQLDKIRDILLDLNPDYVQTKADLKEVLRIKEEERKRKEEEERKRLEEIRRKEEEARRIAAEKAAEERKRQLQELREKERKAQIEKERKAAEEARKAEEERKRLEEERKKTEKEKKEQEEREKQKLLEQKREEERRKNPALRPCSEGKKRYDSAFKLINSINNEVVPRLKSNPQYKDFRLDMKLTIQGKFNQITSSRSKINSFAQIISRELDKARSMGDDFYKLALNLFGKSAVKNAETECGPTPAHAYRSALLIVLVFQNHPDSFDHVYARMIKNCPYIAPYAPRATKDADKAAYFKSINRGFSDNELEDETVYSERMAGIVSVYAAICQTSINHNQPPYNMGHLWTWFASTLNSPAARVTPDLINSALTIAGNKMCQAYGFQFFKILDYIRFVYMDKLSKDSVSANSQLKVLLNNFVKNQQFPPLEGSEIDY